MMMHLSRQFVSDRSGTIAATFALGLIPLMGIVGMGIDYASSAQRHAQLNAIADSAALAAVTPAMMAQGDAQSIAAAQQTFNAQAAAVPGVVYNSANLTVTAQDNGMHRTVTVTYQAASRTLFASLIGQSTIALCGSVQATT